MDRCIFILADGSRPDVFSQMLKEGDLPSISRHIVERGTFSTGVTVFPSTTGPAFLPFLTGCFPGTIGVPGIRWLDRGRMPVGPLFWRSVRSYVGPESYLLNRDIPREVPTLFELAGSSANVMSLVNRGSGFFGNKTKVLRALFWLYGHWTGRWMPADAAAGTLAARSVREGRRFIFSLFPAVDEMSHLTDPFSGATKRAYLGLDRQVGKIVRALKDSGSYDRTALFLFADHGLSATHTHFELWKWVEDFTGRKVLYHPKVFRSGCSAACMVSGNGMAHLYFASDEGKYDIPWNIEKIEKIFPGFIDALLENEAVDLVAARGGSGVVVFSRRGSAEIREQGDRLYYGFKGDDIFSLGREGIFSREEALGLSMKSGYPDGILQLAQIFRTDRSGDIVVSAADGFDLRLEHEWPEHKSSHGSLRREHMLIPLMTSFKFSLQEPLRSADIFRLAAGILNVDGSSGIDARII